MSAHDKYIKIKIVKYKARLGYNPYPSLFGTCFNDPYCTGTRFKNAFCPCNLHKSVFHHNT